MDQETREALPEPEPKPVPTGAQLTPARKAFAASLRIRKKGMPLLLQALTHRSLAEPHRGAASSDTPPGEGIKDNERLEFLGDSILGLLVGEDLFQAYPQCTEGQLTRMKARLVS